MVLEATALPTEPQPLPYNKILLYHLMASSVIRFGEISPLWQKFTSLWQIFDSLLLIWQIAEPT